MGETLSQPKTVHLDTHILVWLYADPRRPWPQPVYVLLQQGCLRYSPVARLELQYLHEIGRLTVPPSTLLGSLRQSLSLQESLQPLNIVADHALSLAWTRDPFDRLIVATAIADKAVLITHDATIRAHFPYAVWSA